MIRSRSLPASWAALAFIAALGAVATAGAPAQEVTFTTHVIPETHGAIRHVLTHDVNGDGRLDLVVGSSNSGWHRNVGTSPPTFVESSIPASGGIDATRLAAGDLDGDGDADIVASTAAGLLWYANDGAMQPVFADGHLIDPGMGGGTQATRILMEDVDANGSMDAVVSRGGDLVWYRNLRGPTPAFQPYFVSSLSSGTHTLGAIIDFDGDDDLDFLTTSHVFLNNGAPIPSFARQTLVFDGQIATSGSGAIWHDLDGDGDLDQVRPWTQTLPFLGSIGYFIYTYVLIAHHEDGVFVCNDESLATSYYFAPTTPLATLCAGDLDLDGDSDLVVSNYRAPNALPAQGVAWFENLSATTWGPLREFDILAGYFAPNTADLDRDGDQDIVFFGSVNTVNYMRWYENHFADEPRATPVLRDHSGDGRLQPGEPGVFTAEVSWLGTSPLTNCAVEVRDVSPGLAFPVTSMVMGDIAPGASFPVSFPFVGTAAMTCGGPLGATLHVRWDERVDGSDRPAQPTSAGRVQSAGAALTESPGAPIPDDDNSGVISTIDVVTLPAATATAIGATVNITHPLRAELEVYLRSPDAQEFRLYRGSWSDEGADIHETFVVGEPGVVPAGGTWSLYVWDRRDEAVGTLDNWTLDLSFDYPECVPWQSPDVPALPFGAIDLAAMTPFVGDGWTIGAGATESGGPGGGIGIVYPPAPATTYLPYWFAGWYLGGTPALDLQPGRVYALRAALGASRPPDIQAVNRLRLETVAGTVDHAFIVHAYDQHAAAIPAAGVRHFLAYARPHDAEADGRRALAFDGIDDGNASGTTLRVWLRSLELASAESAAFIGSALPIADLATFDDWSYANYGPLVFDDLTYFEGGTSSRNGGRLQHHDDDGPSGAAADWSLGDDAATFGMLETSPGATYRLAWDVAIDDGGADGTFPQARFTHRTRVASTAEEYVVRGNGPALDVIGSGLRATYEQVWVGAPFTGAPGPANPHDDLVIAFGLVNYSPNQPDRDGTADLFGVRLEELSSDDPNLP